MLRCGLLGQTLSHSYSPKIHARLADYDYRLFEVQSDQLVDFMKLADFDGINVTIPYKTAVMPYCHALSDEARAIGSVNTIVRRADGTLFGDNTDAHGFARMLEASGAAVQGRKVLVLGSGGASLAVCHVLRAAGAEALVISRSGAQHYGNLEQHADASVIVNTTPLGMYPSNGASPVDLRKFPQCTALLDLIYNPARTALMLQAADLGIPAFGGLSMLVYQAAAAAERFTAASIDPARVEETLLALRREMENIILIGMPGCGKSSIGRALAARLGRDFVDADSELEAESGSTIPAIFAQEGEAGFRARETQVLAQLAKRASLVIATGGGCVTRHENEKTLRQNGRLVFLTRAQSLLAREGRPLSQGADLDAMYAKRLPLYQSFADLHVKNDAPPEQVAKRIEEAYDEIFGTQWAKPKPFGSA